MKNSNELDDIHYIFVTWLQVLQFIHDTELYNNFCNVGIPLRFLLRLAITAITGTKFFKAEAHQNILLIDNGGGETDTTSYLSIKNAIENVWASDVFASLLKDRDGSK